MEQDFATTWSAYVRRQLDAHRGELTNEQVGELIGASGSMVGNWLKAEGFRQPAIDKVVEFWRQFGEGTTLPQAQAAAGFADVEEFDTVVHTRPSLETVDIDELLDEVRKRTESPFSGGGGIRGVMTKTHQTVQRPASLRAAKVARAQRNPSL